VVPLGSGRRETDCALAGAAKAQSAKADKTANLRELIMVSFPD
jgi:hypothetical protein